MVGWHHQLNGHEFEQALGDAEDQGNLACCSPYGCKESDMTEQLRLKRQRPTDHEKNESACGIGAHRTTSGPPGCNPGNAPAIVVTVCPSPSLAIAGLRLAWRLTALPSRQAIIKAEPTDSLVSPVRTMAMDALSYLR